MIADFQLFPLPQFLRAIYAVEGIVPDLALHGKKMIDVDWLISCFIYVELYGRIKSEEKWERKEKEE